MRVSEASIFGLYSAKADCGLCMAMSAVQNICVGLCVSVANSFSFCTQQAI
jgi:hypothetical protein